MILPCITIRQPWASWIAEGIKTVETRGHNRFKCLIGKTIGISAAATEDPLAMMMAQPYLYNDRLYKTSKIWISENKNVKPFSAIVCTATVAAHSKLDSSFSFCALVPCDEKYNLFGLILTNVKKLVVPIPCKGRQGIFYMEVP